MRYLYHLVPPDMEGTTLYPLNQLRNVYPKLYERQVKKYEGREPLMARRIGRLDCLWNDVLFLTAVHPYQVRELIKVVGLKHPKPLRMYRIDADRLDRSLLEVRFHKRGIKPYYEPFDPAKMWNYRVFWADSELYYREMMVQDKRPMLFGHVPHLLYKGTLDVSQARIVEA